MSTAVSFMTGLNTSAVHAALKKSPPNGAKSTGESRPPYAVLDGLNLMRYFGIEHPRFEILLAIVTWLYNEKWDFYVISDANTRYELTEKQGKRHGLAYSNFLVRLPQFFGECPGGCQADPFILHEAAVHRGMIISNDHFEKYEVQHRWVMDTRRRMPVAIFRENIYLGFEGKYRLHLDNNFETAVAKFLDVLKP